MCHHTTCHHTTWWHAMCHHTTWWHTPCHHTKLHYNTWLHTTCQIWQQIKLYQHFLSLKLTTTYHLYNLYKLRPYINKNTVILLTHSLILSRLNYCNTLLTGQTKTTFKRLDAIINRSIRLIYKLKTYDYKHYRLKITTKLDDNC